MLDYIFELRDLIDAIHMKGITVKSSVTSYQEAYI